MEKSRTKYKNDYAREKYKRVPLNILKADFEILQAAAAAAGEPVNAFIKKAISERIERQQTKTE